MTEQGAAFPGYVPRLEAALRLGVPRALVTEEQLGGGGFEFTVVAEEFVGVDQTERQRTVWEIAVATLEREELANVAMILTVTAEEMRRDGEW
jgi:acid stress-induced BolA-like protein IbaG/YrbA